jgi:signal transduction histidine kinase
MLTPNVVTLLVNGITLALASGFLLIVLWNDARKESNRFFAAFLIVVIMWNIGSFLVQAGLLITDDSGLVNFAVGIMEIGFTGSSAVVYILTTVIVGAHSRRLRTLALFCVAFVLTYRLSLIARKTDVVGVDAILSQRFQPSFVIFFAVFGAMTLFLIWEYRRKIRSRGLIVGIVIFVVGQSFIFVNPTLILASLTTSVSSIGALIISFAIIQQEIITPLSERLSQIQAMHKVSLAVSSQIAIGAVLDEIAIRVAGWLGADAVGIFTKSGTLRLGDGKLKLVTIFQLPQQFLGMEVAIGQGVAGLVAEKRQTIYLENYNRDWNGDNEFAVASEAFGSVICVPLVYANSIIGVLMVIAGRQGRLFDREDVNQLELFGAQAAVAIAHGRSFAEQEQLTRQVEAARIQLETVLTSTENPVVAVDRKFGLIFANPAAHNLFPITKSYTVTEIVPRDILPDNIRIVIKQVRQNGSYVYEVPIRDRIYLCHLAMLGKDRINGWVAVLNDVTQLKELDRLKSEMVRMASHDLKNPLMGAMAYLELLDEDLEELGYEDGRKSVSTIEWQLERMNRIIRGILDLERLSVISSVAEVCSPQLVVTKAMEELVHFIADKGVSVEVSVDEDISTFWGVAEQFERVLVNLLENAIKFTMNDNGKVAIDVYEEGGKIIFKVKDCGVGIPEELQPRVFDRFFRGQQAGVEHVTGSGLGLNLVKTIVENHDGKIWLESEEDEGTTFYVSVPSANRND